MDEARRIASNIAKLPNYLVANPDAPVSRSHESAYPLNGSGLEPIVIESWPRTRVSVLSPV
jgi:hypothetical protein